MVENGAPRIVSGTSVGTAAFAGVMALVVEKMGGAGQGSVNPRLYALANADGSVFNPTLTGNNSVDGVTGFWANGATYNLATGLGSVDGAKLAESWGNGVGEAPVLTLTAGSNRLQVVQGRSNTVSLAVATGGSFAGGVNFSVVGLPSGLTVPWSANPMAAVSGVSMRLVTLTLAAVPRGSQDASSGESNIAVTAMGDGLSAMQNIAVDVMRPRECVELKRPLHVPCGTPAPVLPQPRQQKPRFASSD